MLVISGQMSIYAIHFNFFEFCYKYNLTPFFVKYMYFRQYCVLYLLTMMSEHAYVGRSAIFCLIYSCFARKNMKKISWLQYNFHKSEKSFVIMNENMYGVSDGKGVSFGRQGRWSMVTVKWSYIVIYSTRSVKNDLHV